MLSKNFEAKANEDKWYSHWMSKGYFKSVPDEREPYTIVIPPPNVTGILHMGHMLNNTIQDVLIRRARMLGYNACWVPGTDHASIATEAKVVAQLKEQGISKEDITREEFLKHAFEWKDKYGGIILDQLKKLGASCDWDRTRFTMEDDLSRAVIKSFVHLHEKELIYQGVRMTNWDPEAKTALSDEEVNHKEVNSKLYYVKYAVEDSDEHIVIATTRPETILGDTAICVHPEDERYQHLKGKKIKVPLTDRSVEVIFDEYVEIDFGTGALKVTPAHDENDFVLGEKHDLPIIDILNEDATLNDQAGDYKGLNRFVARKKVAADLEELGVLVKIEELKNKVGYSERTNAVIEPRLTRQWFLKMEELAKPALENVNNDNIQFFPPKFKNTYNHWIENIRDWCVSRQLWWGQQIPAYYLPNGTVVVAETKEEALIKAQKIAGNEGLTLNDLRQEEDVVDTWFSSWLWPISVFDGFDRRDELDYYYPTTVLVTGWDIIFFWVARMIFAGYEFEGQQPFKHVYFTGMVRDKQRRKMSKSLGNSPDALGLIDKFGADGVRVGIMLSAPAGNDLLFDDKLCDQGKNFTNKIWNALKLIKMWEVEEEGDDDEYGFVFEWMENRLAQASLDLEKSFETYRLSEALMTLYTLVWDDFCSWYLEFIKPVYQGKIRRSTLEKTIGYFETLMKLLHPYMPFLTEEVYHQLRDREEGDDICVADYPVFKSFNAEIISEGDAVKNIISGVRDVRNKQQIKPKELLSVSVLTERQPLYDKTNAIICKMAHLESLAIVTDEVADAVVFLNEKDKVFVETGNLVDPEQEKERIEKEIAYLEGFVKSVEKKLSNANFVDNAPAAVVQKEKDKLADGQLKIQALKDSL